MRAINHAVTGAILGFLIDEPIVAGVTAVGSHYVCDVIPHYGSNEPDNNKTIRSKEFSYLLYADAVLCGLLVLVLALVRPERWLQAASCAFLAAAPDFLSFGRFVAAKRHKPYKPNLYTKFATNIQWFERPPGAIVEAVWLITGLVILRMFVI